MTTSHTPYRTDLRRVAVRNLAVLHRAVTPEAVREEIDRLGVCGSAGSDGYSPPRWLG